MKKLLISFFLFSFTVAFAGGSSQYSNIIVFGDSLSDIGNNSWVAVPGREGKFDKGAPITNLDSHLRKPMLWVQYLVDKGLFDNRSIIPSQYWYGQNLQTTNVDYAWASAETGDRFLNDLSTPFSYVKNCPKSGEVNAQKSCVPGVILQVQTYVDNLKQSKQKTGQNTLFVIWAGGNDIFDNIDRGFYRLMNAKNDWSLLLPTDNESFAWFPSYNLYRAVNLLIKEGVPPSHIYIFNLPNLAQTPAAIHLIDNAFPNSTKEQAFMESAIKGISEWFNFDVANWVKYGVSGPQKPHVILIDQIFSEIQQTGNFQEYHFTMLQQSCVRNNKMPNCNGYLFFNDKHPTVFTERLLADYLAGQITLNH
jgi:phospholipase/lecithinase/hemolysin